MMASVSHPPRLLASLETSLANLRQAWPEGWPGLPRVLHSCCQRLNIQPADLAARSQALLAWSQQVAQAVEDDGRRLAARQQELTYHNRLHIADTLVCMTHLLLALREQKQPGASDAHLALLCLATMVGHDFMHPGGSNAFPGQFERQAVEALQPLMQAAGLQAQDRSVLEQCILLTDPLCVKASHEAAQQEPFDLGNIHWMTVLVQEADILASSLPQTQQSLTEGLSTEWAPLNPEAAAKLLLPGSRMWFLEHAALFSSPAALHLGLNEVKALQVNALRAQA